MDGSLALIAAVTIGAIILTIYEILKSPFSYPYFHHNFDVSGKRSPQFEDCLDEFLLAGGFPKIEAHQAAIERWKEDSEKTIEQSALKSLRRQQYEEALSDATAFKFALTRQQTRYKQQNYVRTSYKVTVVENRFTCNYAYIANRFAELADIGFECTLRQYHSKNQRKLATRALRELIMERDDYTCQICGKYMPDEVGLQIDHIVPVSKGGKTVVSNLRVLCSKCNSSKSNKM